MSVHNPPAGSEASASKRPPHSIPSQPPALLLAIYPITLLLGSLYSRISPTARPASNSLSSTSNVPSNPSEPVNYFARKGNIFNVYFVKIGWLWTTLAFLSILLTQAAFTNKRFDSNCRLRRVGQALIRYSVVTLSWILTTQWCFGPAIIDRSFVATGGRCERLQATDPAQSSLDPGLAFSSVLCKTAGGAWQGGHDVSGHAFMLVLASVFLVFESLGAMWPADGRGEASKDKSIDSQSKDQAVDGVQGNLSRLSRNFVLTVVGLSWWMLLMTGIWFHTWLEKTSGLFVALTTAYVVYLLPRTLPAWRNLIGIPGV